MLIKSSIKILLFLGLSLPASALQPSNDDVLLPFQQGYDYHSLPLIYKSQPQSRPRYDEKHLGMFFSLFSLAFIALAIRGQQRQDYSQFRDPRKSHLLVLPTHKFEQKNAR